VSWVLEDGFGPYARIFVINADGTGLRQLTPNVGSGDFAFDEGPSWSPDGTRIVFTRNLVLHVINTDGTALTALPNEDFAVGPSWSPDGQRIAYTSLEASGNIRIRNADGSNPVTVTSTPGGGPRWSPDGRRLVFVSTIAGRDQIFVVNVDGTSETRLSFAASDNWPMWSPLPRGTSGAGAAVEIAPTDAKLAPTETRHFTATVRTTNGNVLGNAAVKWSSSDPAVAIVTSSGLVTAVDNGVAQIRAVFGGDTARAQVRVADRVLRNAIVLNR
jgi:Tol biopolymer transport system component